MSSSTRWLRALSGVSGRAATGSSFTATLSWLTSGSSAGEWARTRVRWAPVTTSSRRISKGTPASPRTPTRCKGPPTPSSESVMLTWRSPAMTKGAPASSGWARRAVGTSSSARPRRVRAAASRRRSRRGGSSVGRSMYGSCASASHRTRTLRLARIRSIRDATGLAVGGRLKGCHASARPMIAATSSRRLATDIGRNCTRSRAPSTRARRAEKATQRPPHWTSTPTSSPGFVSFTEKPPTDASRVSVSTLRPSAKVNSTLRCTPIRTCLRTWRVSRPTARAVSRTRRLKTDQRVLRSKVGTCTSAWPSARRTKPVVTPATKSRLARMCGHMSLKSK